MRYVYTLRFSIKLSTSIFQGGREVADFVDFLKRKATNPVVISGEDEDEGEKKKKKKKKSKDKEEL